AGKSAARKGAAMADSSTRAADTAADARTDEPGQSAPFAETPPPAATVPRRGSGSILFYVALSLIAAALVVVSAPLWQPQVNDLLGLRQASAPVTDDRLTALQGDVQALSEQVQAAVDSGALNEAIAAATDPLAAQIKSAQQELADLKTKVE